MKKRPYRFWLPLLSILWFTTGCSSPGSEAIEKDKMAAEIRGEFRHCWQGYRQFAWGHDELRPLSKSPRDWYQRSLLMTPVDAFDTMLIMGLKEDAAEARELILSRLDFNIDASVKNFEITIRLLGGLLSAYQMDGDPRFLKLAKDLGKRLLPVFSSPTGMPYTFVHLRSGEVQGPVTNPAEIGTLLLEFGTLSKLTGDPVYYDKAKKALVEVFNRRSAIGLVGARINVETGAWVDSTSHISGMIDSYYEYLYKAWALFQDADCLAMWQASVPAVHRYLGEEVRGEWWYGQAQMYTGKRLGQRFGALDAFFPAVLALSGDLDRAKKLQRSCLKMWTLAGIEPEVLDYNRMEIIEPSYVLRPEIIESAYYLYTLTGDDDYQRMGGWFFSSLKKYCRTDAGYASLKSVISKEQEDVMESFFLAETLKYLYLLFAPPEALDFHHVVFNTEAHPLRKR